MNETKNDKNLKEILVTRDEELEFLRKVSLTLGEDVGFMPWTELVKLLKLLTDDLLNRREYEHFHPNNNGDE